MAKKQTSGSRESDSSSSADKKLPWYHDGLQFECSQCGDCCSGCNVGSKNTVALTYLPDAVRHGADVFTEISVRRVVKLADRSWQVEALPTAETKPGKKPSREPTKPISSKCSITIDSAGRLNRPGR